MSFNRIAIGLILLGAMARAQDTSPYDRETIQQLVQQVKELQAQVQVLESRTTDSPASVTPEAGASPATEAAENRPSPSLSQELHEFHGIQLRGFGEVDYKVLNQRQPELGTYGFVPGSAGNFYTGDFDLLVTSRISDKASVLSEIVFGEGDAQTFGVDLERALLKYDLNDHLKVSFGRYHVGIGYYNTAFHSGSWLQTTADRPLIMEFTNDGGPLPTQAVGVFATGTIPSGKMGLNYTLEYGSSDSVRPAIDRTTATNDENNGNHVAVGFFIRPDSIPGLQIGGSIYHDQISDSIRSPSARLGQTIINVHGVYIAHRIEFLNEGFLIRHAYQQGSTVYNMPAFYSQVSRRFSHVTPFFRYQYINANQNSILADIALRYGPSFGARYDFNDNIAFKTQLDRTFRKVQPDLDGLHLQLAFTF